jgi:oxygen-independent coproporphyrinogen-3 oxidase
MRRNENLVRLYLDRLEREAEKWHSLYPGPLDTIYFGGGTPSHLVDAELERIIRVLDRTWGWPARIETTFEADPLTFDPERLQKWRALGVNRLSIGLQSTQNPVLHFLGRLHNSTQGLEAIHWALQAGFDTSADLITAVPGQDITADLNTLAITGVPHVSVYTLTVEPATPFGRRGIHVDPEREADAFESAEHILSQYGYVRYEVSSHARPGSESQHNQIYWHGNYFLALGPSAASFIPQDGTPGVRLTNPPIKEWLQGHSAERHEITPDTFVLEMLMTGLRTRRGIDLELLERRTGIRVNERYRVVIDDALEQGFLELEGANLRATNAGLMLLNTLLGKFFDATIT